MNIAIDVLEKEIERREILLQAENNVLIQNDMSNDITGLKNDLENLKLHIVGVTLPKYDKNNIDLMYLLGSFNTGGLDGLDKELKRLKELKMEPWQIINLLKQK